ncbi:cystine transporter [Monosporozyma servazzii]
MMIGVNLTLEDVLGFIYVSAWSISMYSPLWENLKCKSARGISMDFAILNTMGYFYLLLSIYLQIFHWVPYDSSLASKMVDPNATVANMDVNNLDAPKLTMFDLFYCFHGEIINLVTLSQLFWGKSLWKFPEDRYRRMKSLYFKIFLISLSLFFVLTIQFCHDNWISGNWNNQRTLQYCNKLFILKISMSLIKYIPQVKHNAARKSVKGFSIHGVMLDIVGSIASVLQLLLQLSRENGFSWMLVVLNFGKIGLSLVTMTFCSVFIVQWLIYGNE